MSAHDAVAVQKTGVYLREHRSDLHVMWSFQPAAARTRGYTLAVPARTRYLHLREALDAVLGDARKE